MLREWLKWRKLRNTPIYEYKHKRAQYTRNPIQYSTQDSTQSTYIPPALMKHINRDKGATKVGEWYTNTEGKYVQYVPNVTLPTTIWMRNFIYTRIMDMNLSIGSKDCYEIAVTGLITNKRVELPAYIMISDIGDFINKRSEVWDKCLINIIKEEGECLKIASSRTECFDCPFYTDCRFDPSSSPIKEHAIKLYIYLYGKKELIKCLI